jgi:CelD/BcsL family acetyltransferase involved in cellulose biosynthesis
LTLIAFLSIPSGPTAAKELEKYPRHPKLRSNLLQGRAKLAALGTLQLRRAEKDGAEDLQRFYDMEASGWKGKERSAIFCDAKTRQFFDKVVQAAERLGQLRLYGLTLDDRPIAAHLGFTYRGRYWAADSAYDEEYRDHAPGHLIVDAILRDCSERRISHDGHDF